MAHRILLLVALVLALGAGESPRPDATRIAFIGVYDRAEPLVQQAAASVGVRVELLHADRFASETQPPPSLAPYRVVFILNIDPVSSGGIIEQWKQAMTTPGCRLQLVVLDHRESQTSLRQAGAIIDDPHIPPYWRANGAVNMARMLGYVATTYLGMDRPVHPPVEVPEWGYYLPGREEPTTQVADLAVGMGWTAKRPTAAILIQQSFWVSKDTAVVDLLADRLRAAGLNPAILFSASAGQLTGMLRELAPDLIIEDRHGSIWDDGGGSASLLGDLDAVYMRPLTMLTGTIPDWMSSKRGLNPTDVGLCQIIQECAGAIEPVVIGGLQENVLGFRLHEPIRERVDHFAARAAAWARLRHLANADKRIALISYNKTLSRGDLLRGSPTGAFLDGPQSMLVLWRRLRQEGYTLPDPPTDEHDLIGLFQAHVRNAAPWDQAELERMANLPEAILVHETRLARWLERLSPDQLKDLERNFGKPPGRLMVVERNGGQKFIVLPALRQGNLLLAVQPERGERMDETLLHSRDVPPPYHYLAFYWWLQEEFKADALIHFGTHGSLELLPGREDGMGPDDWSDICAGTIPIIDLWIMDNLGEATIARRRSYACLVDHLAPPAVRNGLQPEEQALADDLRKWSSLDRGTLKEQFARQITATAQRQGFVQRMRLTIANGVVGDPDLVQLANALHERQENATPMSLHILGQAPPEPMVASVIADSLGKPWREEVAPGAAMSTQRAAALDRVQRHILGQEPADAGLQPLIARGRNLADRIHACGNELDALARALSGRFIRPGPGPDPVRNPASVPTGRNLYALNPEEIPTKASWEVAKSIIGQLLAQRTPTKVAVDLSGMTTMQDFGITEGQILCLLGVEPVWDPSGLVDDVRLIPRDQLGRSRVDVFIAMGSHYRENFPSRIRLLDKAVRLAVAAPEADNPVRLGTMSLADGLRARGMADSDVQVFATARIFGTKPGNLNGTNILYLVPRSGAWSRADAVASIYIDNMSFAYVGSHWGEQVDGLYQAAMQHTDTVIHTWSSQLTSPLSNHHVYEYLGGLSMAVAAVTGAEPTAFVADTRDPEGARMRNFDEVLHTTLQSELLAKRWIAGMQEHGYAGAGHIAELVQNTFGWNVTRPSSLPGGVWDDIDAIYRQDRYGLDLPAWMDRENPHAQQEVYATLIEASRKGYWKPSASVLADLCERYARSVVTRGDSGGLVSGGNADLAALVASQVVGLGKHTLARAFQHAVAPPAPQREAEVRGTTLVAPETAAGKPSAAPQAPSPARLPKEEPTQDARLPAAETRSDRWLVGMGGCVVLLLIIGILRRIGAPRGPT